jgi:acyl-CoA synthetase (AMP-forming)/AMP-acid ligase II
LSRFAPDGVPASSIDAVLRWRAAHTPGATSHIFLADGERELPPLSYAELDRSARAIAARVRQECAPGDRVLLLYPPGLEFVAAFFGCLSAGVVAVPAYPPRNKSHMPRIQAILADAGASLALTTAKTLAGLRGNEEDLPGLRWLATDTVPLELADAWVPEDHDEHALAFLQYTSGSTGTPKGVMVSHRNILYNSLYIQQSFSLSQQSVSVSWLPSFHDMGLIDGVIQPLYTGFPGVLLPPVSFIQKPLRWLQAVTRYRGTHGGGPNFGYDLCTQKVTDEQRAELDLSSWRSAYNGAEPVRPHTIRQFTECFAPCGFGSKTFYPCYGLAETTLMVTGGHVTLDPVMLSVDKTALEQGRALPPTSPERGIELVGSGKAILETQALIVDPESGIECAEGLVGEVWLSGPTLCQGYWHREKETQEAFGARLAGSDAGPFLRTGDLGFLKDGELFVSGRIKDLIIVRGRNLYPQDVEWVAEEAHPALRAGCGAAFSVEKDGEERLVVVQELERHGAAQPRHPGDLRGHRPERGRGARGRSGRGGADQDRHHPQDLEWEDPAACLPRPVPERRAGGGGRVGQQRAGGTGAAASSDAGPGRGGDRALPEPADRRAPAAAARQHRQPLGVRQLRAGLGGRGQPVRRAVRTAGTRAARRPCSTTTRASSGSAGTWPANRNPAGSPPPAPRSRSR